MALVAGFLVVALVAVGLTAGTTLANSRAVAERESTRWWGPETTEEGLLALAQDGYARQEHALLAGDEKAWIDTIDPSQHELVTQMRRQFKALRALRIAKWDATKARLSMPPKIDLDMGTVEHSVYLHMCFDVPDCKPAALPRLAEWQWRDGQMRLRRFTVPDGERGYRPPQPQPWEVSEFTVARGRRVTVIIPSTMDRRTDDLVAIGDRAAAVADRWIRWPEWRPPTYHIYWAGPAEWRTWYGYTNLHPNVVGYMPFTGQPHEFNNFGLRVATEVVINASLHEAKDPRLLESTLRHELSHVATMRGSYYAPHDLNWWLTEGIAEYIQHGRAPLSTYPHGNDLRQYVRSPQWRNWRGLIEDRFMGGPPANASRAVIAAKYGTSYLAVRYIAETWGDEKMLAFFAAQVRPNGIRRPARDILGVPTLEDLFAQCVAYINRVAA